MNENPYASPAIEADIAVAAAAPVGEMQIASQGKRFINLIVDGIALQVMVQGTAFVMGLCYGIYLVAAQGDITAADEGRMEAIGMFLGFAVYLTYYVFAEWLFGRTLAKLLTGTKVVRADGTSPRFGQIVGRSFARFIPFEAFSFLGNEKPVGWHDRLSGTRVITIR